MRSLAMALALIFLIAAETVAQQPAPPSPERDYSVPWWVCVAVVTAMSSAIGKLYYDAGPGVAAQLVSQAKAHESEKVSIRGDYQAQIDAQKKACHEEIMDVRNRIEAEKDERLKEQERLLREQKELMRELMSTSKQISKAVGGEVQ